MATTAHHNVVVIGGGMAGISLAARLRRAKVSDVAIIEPSDKHYYQPAFTLVGGGAYDPEKCVRSQASMIPAGQTWIRAAAQNVDPDNNTVMLADGGTVSYDYLVVAPGIQLNWGKVPGLADAMDTPFVSSNYNFETAPKTWELIQKTTSGTAIFTMPSAPIKCAGAPQKIAYLAADYWREQGVLNNMNIVLVLPTPGMFGVKVFADELERVAAGYGIEVRKSSEMVEVDPAGRTAVIADLAGGGKETLSYDMMHVVPPQSAPDWVKASPLSNPEDPLGYVQIDQYTMQHVRYPNIFSLGDAGSSPNSKTGAAIRKQAPTVAANLTDFIAGRPLSSKYGGYASCPLVTSRHQMLLAEFDYTMEPTPSIPFINTKRTRRDMWYVKKYGLPFLYWNLMSKGLA
jgi:sulfide:quinone oxidoreductase